MYVCTGAHEGQRLERAAKKLFIYNSAVIQACYLAKSILYSPAGMLVRQIVACSSKVSLVPSSNPQFVHLNWESVQAVHYI